MRLSVCIPTHHGRCALLDAALASITASVSRPLPMELEIVVSDNASEDGTAELMSRFANAHPQLRVVYGRNDRDIVLGNIFRVVQRASGDWCWLFGSDDLMVEDGLDVSMRTLLRFPNATGMGFAKANFRHDMQLQLEPDAAPFYPSQTDTTLFTDYAQGMREAAFLFAFMGCNIVRRDRFLAAAARVADEAIRRHPTWPQLVVFSEMFRTDPFWIWLPYVLVRARAGRPYLVEQDGTAPNLARMHTLLADGLHAAWTEIAGSDRALLAALLQKSYAVAASDHVVRNLKTLPDQTLGRDLLILRSFTRAFWSVPDFRRRCLPLLLIPARFWRARVERERMGSMPRLEPDDINTQLDVTAPAVLAPRMPVDVRTTIVNRSSRALLWGNPFPVALGYRWIDRATGHIVKDDGRTLLPHAVARDESLTLQARINAPWNPGRYELRVSLVQEHVAWFDDINAANGARCEIELIAPG